MADRYDVVVYGATGFTGSYIMRAIATSPLYKGKTVAVAGRSESKLKKVLDEIAASSGVNSVRDYPMIVADTSDADSLAAMAKKARVIINAVGPYRLHGEAVVRAAVENGASHVDISGEDEFLERIHFKYSQQAKDNGVYVVGACGWDSIPCDMGVDFLKRNFSGTLAHVETFVRNQSGPSGYAINDGTYQTIILGISSMRSDDLSKIRRAIMPGGVPLSVHKPPTRAPMWHVQRNGLDAWAMPFLGSDKSVVQRTQYYDHNVNGKRPVLINTYFALPSFFWASLVGLWLGCFAVGSMCPPTRKFLQSYPDLCSFKMFTKSGPTEQQIKETSFSYYFFGKGWTEGQTPYESVTPTKSEAVVCRGPDPAYVATSGCVVSAALALLDDRYKLPTEGGVYTTATAFRDTRIYEYLKSFGITFEKL